MEISKMPNMEFEVTYGNGEKRNTNIIVDKNGNLVYLSCYLLWIKVGINVVNSLVQREWKI